MLPFVLGLMFGAVLPRLIRHIRYRLWARSPAGRAIFRRAKAVDRKVAALALHEVALKLRAYDVREPGRYL